MAEAVVTVGFVAAIIEISSFAKKLVDRWKEFHSKAKGVPKAFRSIYVQLPLVVFSLKQISTLAESGLLNEDSLISLESVIEACREEAKDLEIILNKILPTSSTSSCDRRALVMKSMRYETEVRKCTANLDSHIQKLILHQTSISAASALQLPLLCDKEPHQIVSLTNQVGRLTAKPSLLRESLEHLEEIRHPDSEPTAEESSGENDLLLPKSSLEQDHFPLALQRRPTSETRSLLYTQARERLCTCKHPRIEKSWTKAVLGVTFGLQSLQTHHGGCPLLREEDEKTKMFFDISLMSQLVNKAVRLSVSLQYGAGGMSVSPSLILHGMRRCNSPIFALMKTLDLPVRTGTSERIFRMGEVLPQIKLLVQNGQASPHEVDENGRTVFDGFFNRRWIHSDESKPIYREPRDFFLKSLCNLGFSYNEESGVGMFGEGTVLDKIVRQDLENGIDLDVGSLSGLINLGVGFGANPEHFLHWLQGTLRFYGHDKTLRQNVVKFAIGLMSSISDFADRMPPLPHSKSSANVCSGCNCNGLHFAVLERSVSKVEQYLRCASKMLFAQNLLGQTPLHLAADWPWACKALLIAGADLSATDFCGNLPLSYACFQDCFETVKMLVAANSPLSSSCDGLSVLDRAVTSVNNASIRVTLINELAARRRKLLTSSQALLPKHVFEENTRGLNGLPDFESFSLITSLSDAGDCTDPNHWSYTYSSVYDLEEITVEIAECLFTAGFTNLEGKDPRGFTILLRSAMRTARRPELVFAKICWLLSKGVSLRRLVEINPLSDWLIPSVNVVSAMLGLVLGQKVRLIQVKLGTKYALSLTKGIGNSSLCGKSSENPIKEVLRRVLGSQYQTCHDLCECYCSLHGCTPMAMLLKGLVFNWWCAPEIEEAHDLRGQSIDWILEVLAHDLTASEKVELTNSALRFCLFEDLGLRHTCCRPIQWDLPCQGLLPPIEAEEACEIREEDEQLQKLFHGLLLQAESELHSTSKSFSEVWFNFYRETVVSRLENEFAEKDVAGINMIMQKHNQNEEVSEPEERDLECRRRAFALADELYRMKLDVPRLK